MNRRTIRNGLLALMLSSLAMLLPAYESSAQTCSPACQQCMLQVQQFMYYCNIACQYSGACPCTAEQIAAMIAHCQTL